jgi:hypothetical protein
MKNTIIKLCFFLFCFSSLTPTKSAPLNLRISGLFNSFELLLQPRGYEQFLRLELNRPIDQVFSLGLHGGYMSNLVWEPSNVIPNLDPLDSEQNTEEKQKMIPYNYFFGGAHLDLKFSLKRMAELIKSTSSEENNFWNINLKFSSYLGMASLAFCNQTSVACDKFSSSIKPYIANSMAMIFENEKYEFGLEIYKPYMLLKQEELDSKFEWDASQDIQSLVNATWALKF